jgi:hypothetical protein|tara:strand:- start:7731 stop:7841 length:111 start_codon:yes stop_codon:yes gene_type:complete
MRKLTLQELESGFLENSKKVRGVQGNDFMFEGQDER